MVGSPDAERGEIVKACVILKPGEIGASASAPLSAERRALSLLSRRLGVAAAAGRAGATEGGVAAALGHRGDGCDAVAATAIDRHHRSRRPLADKPGLPIAVMAIGQIGVGSDAVGDFDERQRHGLASHGEEVKAFDLAAGLGLHRPAPPFEREGITRRARRLQAVDARLHVCQVIPAQSMRLG
ncbi:MAG: hypothetical protein ACLQJR_10655 [Stellaceae bacterium]